MRAVRRNWLLVELRAHRSGSVRLEGLHVTQRVAGLRPRTFLARFAFLLDHHPSPFCPRVLEPHLQQRKTPCSLVGGYQNSEEPQRFHLHDKSSLLILNNNNLGFKALVRRLIFVLNFLRHHADRRHNIHWTAISEEFSLKPNRQSNLSTYLPEASQRKTTTLIRTLMTLLNFISVYV